MAVFNVPNYKDADGLGFPLNFRRGNPNPLDNSSVWASLDAAKIYASTDPTAYVGQVLSVVNEDDGSVDVYKIQNTAGDLEMVGTVTLGDGVTIIKNDDDTLSIMGFDEAEAGAQPRKTAEGTIEWVKPDTTTVDGLSTAVEGLEADVDTLRSDVGANTAAIEVLNGDSDTEGSVAYQIAAVVAGADADFDTLKEIADWIAAHPDSVATINAAIQKNTDAIDALEALVGTDPVAIQIANAITEALQVEGADKYALATDLSDAVDRVAANEADIDSLQALVGEGSVANQIKAAVKETIDGVEVDKYALRVHSHAVSDITGLGAQLDTLATKDTVNGIDNRVKALEDGLDTSIDAAIQEHVTAADAKYETIENVALLSGQVDTKVAALEKADADNLAAAKTYTEEQIAALKISEYAKQVDLDTATAAIDAIKDHDTVDSFADVMTEVAKKQDIIPENTYDAYGAAAAVDAKLENYKTEANGRLDALEAVDNATQTELNESVEALEAADAAILAKIGDVEESKTVVGLIGAAQTAADNAQAAADAAQDEVDKLEVYVGTIPEGYTEANVIAYINKKAEETLNAASGGSSESAASVLAALNTYKTENDPKVAANTEAAAKAQAAAEAAQATADAAYVKPTDGIATSDLHADVVASLAKADSALQAADIENKADKATTLEGYGIADAYTKTEVNGLVGTKVDQAACDTKVAALEAEDSRLAGLISDNADAISAVSGNVDTLIGADTGKSVRAIANEELAAQLIADDAKESLDTLQEIAAWIQKHPDDASAMNAAIEALEAKVDTGEQTVSAYVTAAINALKIGDYATVEALNAAIARIAELEAASATHATKTEVQAVQDQIDALGDTYATDAELTAAIASEVERANGLYATQANVATHVDNTDIHVTTVDKEKWNGAQAAAEATAAANLATARTEITAEIATAKSGAEATAAEALAGHVDVYEAKVAELAAEDADIRVDFAAADDALQSGVDANTAAIVKINGDANTDGSFAKADAAVLSDAKAYSDEKLLEALQWGSF